MRSVFLLLALAGALPAQRALPFGDRGWELTGQSAVIDTLAGVESARLDNGRAIRRDVRLENGTIDFDVMVSSQRSFVHVNFRMQTDREYQEFYLRPHKPNAPDAVQYAPVFQGRSGWQLYHGPGGTGVTGFTPGVWTRVRVVLSGRRAAIFVGDTAKPVIVVPYLAQEPKPGYIALRGFLPAGVPASGTVARFANVRVRPDFIPFAFPAETTPAPAPGAIRAWTVGEAFATTDTARSAFDSKWLARTRRVDAAPSGLLELHRLVDLPEFTDDVGIVARVNIIADSAGSYRMDLGFSDAATVFVNRTPVYYGNEQYDYEGRRDGLIGYGQATLFLPLRAGRNEVAVLVTDHFGGWGLMARLPNAKGLRVEP